VGICVLADLPPEWTENINPAIINSLTFNINLYFAITAAQTLQ